VIYLKKNLDRAEVGNHLATSVDIVESGFTIHTEKVTAFCRRSSAVIKGRLQLT